MDCHGPILLSYTDTGNCTVIYINNEMIVEKENSEKCPYQDPAGAGPGGGLS